MLFITKWPFWESAANYKLYSGTILSRSKIKIKLSDACSTLRKPLSPSSKQLLSTSRVWTSAPTSAPASKSSSPPPPTQFRSKPSDCEPNVYSSYSTDNAYKSLCLISILVDIGILPEVPALPDDLAHVDLDLLQPVDVHLHAGAVDLVEVAQDLLDGLVEVCLAILVLHVGYRHVDLVLRREVDAVVVLRDLVGDLDPTNY